MAWFLGLSGTARQDKTRTAKAYKQKKAKKASTRKTTFRPGLEMLESREVPTASAALSAAGVLTVNGSSGNDSITLRQAGGKVTVSGVSKSFNVSSINSVVVNAGKGNDTVSLSGLTTAWTKQIRVTSAAGTDRVRLLDGSLTSLVGPNKSLTIPANNGSDGGGGDGGGGTSGDWFDTNINDAALRSLLRTDYNSGGIDRNEMLGVFDQVENDGTVNGTEFNDLKTVANNSFLFGSFSYVTDLTKSVVLGSVANARYQGAPLGNLAAGSSGAQLDNLVHKWFLGSDRPDASYDGLTVTYRAASGTLFGASGPQYTDVQQGAVGDCYYVGALAEIALRSPSAIQNMFIENGDGTYTVRFYQNGVSHYVTVDNQLPTYYGGYFLYANMGGWYADSSNVLWVALAEKAYVQMNEAGWLRPSARGGGINAYDAVAGGYFGDAIEQVMNQASSDHWVSGAADATTLANAWSSGKMIAFATKSSPSNSQIVGNHLYIVVGYNSSTQTVTLFNPWGIDNGSQYPGLVSLTLSELTSSFDYWSVA